MIDQTLRDKLVNAYMSLIPLIALNLFWFVVSIPLVTLIPATGGLFYATNALAHGKSAGWSDFWQGFKQYFWKSWLWGLLNLFVIVILASNLLFYATAKNDVSTVAEVVVIAILILWVAVQIQVMPLLFEQEEPKFPLALRNSLVLLLQKPLYAFGGTILILTIFLFSTLVLYPAWIFMSASLCTFIANWVTVNSIKRTRPKSAPVVEPPLTEG